MWCLKENDPASKWKSCSSLKISSKTTKYFQNKSETLQNNGKRQKDVGEVSKATHDGIQAASKFELNAGHIQGPNQNN